MYRNDAPEKANYMRSLSTSSLGDFLLSSLNRFANARRDFRETGGS